MLALMLSAGALFTALSATATGTPVGTALPRGRSLSQSRELWATVDVCNPTDEPNTIGVRGSMPSDGHGKDAMFMGFQLQYLETKSKVWVNLAHGADSGFVAVGAGKTARQGGSSFQLGPAKSGTGYALRGVVTFQWRRDGKVVHQVTRATTAGHQSVAGSDPAGYSAAECVIS